MFSFNVKTQIPVKRKLNRKLQIPWSIALSRVFFMVSLSAFASALIEPIYLLFLKSKFDVSVLVLAFVFLPSGLLYAILPRYSGQWSDKWGRGPVIATASLLLALYP